MRRPDPAETVVDLDVEALQVQAVTTERGALAVLVLVGVGGVEENLAADRGRADGRIVRVRWRAGS